MQLITKWLFNIYHPILTVRSDCHTFAKLTLVHLVPLVKGINEAVPVKAPVGVPRKDPIYDARSVCPNSRFQNTNFEICACDV